MGQRLTVNVHRTSDTGEVLASIYYHWSGYTLQTLMELRSLHAWILEHNLKEVTDEEARLSIIRYAESKGGGVDEDDMIYVKEQFEGETFNEEGLDRNEGLVAVSFDGISNMQVWKAMAKISIDDGIVYTEVYDIASNYEQYCYIMEEEYEVTPTSEDKMQVIDDVDITHAFPADKLDSLIERFKGMIDNNIYDYKDANGEIITLIQ